MTGRRQMLMKAAVLCFLLACSAAYAQDEERPRRIGFLSHAAAQDRAAGEQYAAFVSKLDELGFAAGRKLHIETRYAAGAYDRLALLAAELVRAQVEVIVTNGTPATSAARRATATVPIVAASFAEPVASGFAASLERPGGNVTGFTSMGGAVYERRLELLAEAVPGAARIGVLANPGNEFFLRILPGMEAAAKRLGRELVLVYARNAKGIEEAFALLRTKHIGALLVAEHRALAAQSRLIAALALKDRLPAAFPTARGAEDGGLLGCATDPQERYRSAAGYVVRILRGEKVEEMPILQPIELELVLNLRTAAALGLAVPDRLRYRAGRVIE